MKKDLESRNQMVQENLGLVWSIVHRFRNRGYETEDLFQIGSIGLIKAVDRFDETFGVQFSTYAVPMISGEIRRFIRDDGAIKISREVKGNHWKVQHAVDQLEKFYGQGVTIGQVVEHTGLTRDEVVLAMEAPVEVDSLQRPIAMGEGRELCLEDSLFCNANEEAKADNRMLLEQLLGQLEAKERQIIYLRYFQDYTQSMVAKRLDMSQVQVSRLEKKIFMRLRGNLD